MVGPSGSLPGACSFDQVSRIEKTYLPVAIRRTSIEMVRRMPSAWPLPAEERTIRIVRHDPQGVDDPDVRMADVRDPEVGR